MSSIKHIAVIAGSPKAPGKAASDHLAEIAAEALREGGTEPGVINARRALTKKQTDEAFAAMAAADALVIIFPLYIFCLPGILQRFLQMYQAYAAKHPGVKNAPVYAVVNCGFPEPEINEEAVHVIGRFAAAVGADFRFGVMIGGGGMLTYPAPPVRKALEKYRFAVGQMLADIQGGSREPAPNITLPSPVGRKLYYTMGNIGWWMQIRKNHKKRRDLYARPYQPVRKS